MPLLPSFRLTATLISYHTFFCLSSTFFRKLQNSFFSRSMFISTFSYLSSLSSESFIIISCISPFVNGFLHFFALLEENAVFVTFFGGLWAFCTFFDFQNNSHFSIFSFGSSGIILSIFPSISTSTISS